ncbi:hypothetical protein M407DRAFT_6140 [Tulasnella calospora MUT 4182]|uniref:Uncharacterized protein n=1 Tax=Tulasnella calospora MUT 4182 TaxID=1051891 RepID=A0A0C3L6I0_9AGAM|nr:hypothetical protein M407DRAFT_6140 [Tulasnella calospora MUT 4182]
MLKEAKKKLNSFSGLKVWTRPKPPALSVVVQARKRLRPGGVTIRGASSIEQAFILVSNRHMEPITKFSSWGATSEHVILKRPLYQMLAERKLHFAPRCGPDELTTSLHGINWSTVVRLGHVYEARRIYSQGQNSLAAPMVIHSADDGMERNVKSKLQQRSYSVELQSLIETWLEQGASIEGKTVGTRMTTQPQNSTPGALFISVSNKRPRIQKEGDWPIPFDKRTKRGRAP